MDPCSKHISLCDISSDDNSILKKMRKENWYMPQKRIDDIPKRSLKTRKNLMSESTHISNLKGFDNVISVPERTVHESTSFKANTQSSKKGNQRPYPITSKKKPTNRTMKPISSASYTSSTSSESSHNSTVANQKNVKIALSSFNMSRLAAQINSAGRRLIKLAASMDAGKIDECDINFGEMKANTNTKNEQHAYHEKKLSRSNSQVPMEKSRIIKVSGECPDVNRSNCCSSRQYSSRRFNPLSAQSRGSKSKKIQRLDDELNRSMTKNDSFNSIHSVDGHSRRQHRNEVHSSLDRSITPSIVLNGLHPENCDVKNVRETAYDGVMRGLNRKKKTNKNPRMKKKDWKFDDIDFLDEDII